MKRAGFLAALGALGALLTGGELFKPLESWFRPQRVVSVYSERGLEREFYMPIDESADCAPKVQEAIDFSASLPGPVTIAFSAGTFKMNSDAWVHGKDATLQGSGSHETVLVPS